MKFQVSCSRFELGARVDDNVSPDTGQGCPLCALPREPWHNGGVRLYLLRHGKSDWNLSYGGDHERPLAKRGRNSAGVIGRYLSGIEPFPQKVICSSAQRAEETVRLAAEAGNWSCPIHTTDRLYSSSSDDLLDFLRGCSDDDQSLLVAGHMPSLPDLIGDLVGGARVKFPTAALAAIDLSVRSWSEVEPGCGTLLWLVTPKILAAGNPGEP